MYLKGLELNGFKSFSNKVCLDFTKGITAIVGPNGSGKSNILDAILWVLGEQSYKSIRAKDSTDVIFSGGKNKKARSSATVSLIISNEDRFLDLDSDNIVISRTINRNGENEYSLNGKKTRLKDINALLMDTGIGKQAYSVIGQGKVERIIASSPAEIRAVIDEAAGIKKAKTEKELSNKKLESVQNEIEKIELVEEELKRHLDRLEQESKKARTYMAYTKKINVLKYMLFCYVKNSVQTRLDNLNENKKNLEKELETLNNDLDNLLMELKNINESKNKIEQDIKELTLDNENQTQRVKQLQQLEFEYITKKANFNAQISSKQERVKELEDKKTQLSKTLEQYDAELKSKKEEIDGLNLQREKLDRVINLNIEMKKDYNEKIKLCEENYKKYDVDKLRLKFENEDLEKRIEKSKIKLEQVTKEKEESIKKLDSIGSEFSEKENLLQKEQEFEILKNTIEDLKKQKHNLQVHYDEISSKYTSLYSIIENQKNMSAGIQFVCKNSKNDKKVLGPLVNMLDIPKKYQMALSTIGAYSFNDIIVEDSQTANKYISLLKESKIGTVSFIPIDNIKVKAINTKKYDGSIDYARNLVKNISGNKNVDKVIEYVFSNSLVVEKLENGVKLSKFVNDRIVTLDGDIISATGRMTGGYNTRKIDNSLLKNTQLKELETEKEQSFKNLENINSKIAENQEVLEKLRVILDDLKSNYETYKYEKLKIQREQDTYTFEIEENEEFIKTKTTEIAENVKLIKAIEKNIVDNEKHLKELISKLNGIEENEEYEKQLKEIDIELAILNEKQLSKYARYEEINEEYVLVNDEYNTISIFLDKKDELYNDIENEINKIKNEIEKIESNDIKLKENIKNLNDQHKKLSDEHISSLSNKSDLEINIMSIENNLNNICENIRRDEEKLSSNNEKLSELEDEKESIISNYEYQEILDETQAKSVEKNINLNEKSRANIGSVNLESIEEFEQEQSKYEKLTNDKFDLLRSRESILDLINEINNDIMTKFSDAITNITSNFEYMCKELLQNAKGTIKLLDKDDLLETGVELSIKYKNKPEQTLTLLSGGEKSMLALSFIMAIFMYKPSPFTFFDEVEAALDEANTKKIIKVLKEFINKSQFILITHNKETMKGSNRLYGVTMNKEIGESMIVNVDI
ncbi:chromosome segregation protein SMC [Caviibacter abscessus]|uniref:chromosome segregation protein SMC n=1 Tax=Caviibacter abscessus TaxID=1766719 RepID=UPI0008333E6D|nr:chromosome segregation protein SMC [Caviibacter abscessus]